MKIINKKNHFILTLAWLVCTEIKAENNDLISIPIVNDARVFYQFSDNFPAMVNYFTAHDKRTIVSYYTKQYGEYASLNEKRGRITVTYSIGKAEIRVIISRQDKVQQVDVIYQLK